MKNYIKIAILLLILILSIGMVSASEIDDGSAEILDDMEADSMAEADAVSVSQEETDTVAEADAAPLRDGTPITKTLDGGSFSDIQSSIDELKDGDTLELKGTFQSNGQGINVTKSITIKSSVKATLDGKKSSEIFHLYGKNIVLNGLNLINSKSELSSAVDGLYEGSGNAKHSILNCNFENNVGVYGGSCIFMAESVQFDVSSCTFKNNKADDGAAIHSYSKNAVVKKCTFIGNNAKFGGAIYSSAPGLSVANSIFKNNKADEGGCIFSEKGVSIKDSTFNNNSADSGGVILAKSTSSFINSKFINNYANYGGVININAPLSISKSYFEKNGAKYWGGIVESSSKVDIADSKFVNNKKGASLISTVVKITVKNSYFTQNHATILNGDSYVANSKFYKNYKTSINGGKVNVINSVFKSNKGGSAINCEGKSTVKKCSFIGNTAREGAAINGQCTVSYSNFTKNKATSRDLSGGAISGYGIMKIYKCRFVKNTARYLGGAIYGGTKATITKCTFLNNRAHGAAAIYAYKLVVKNCVFKNNKYGAIKTTYISISKSTFIKNKDNLKSGAIEIFKGTVKNCLFKGNYARLTGGALCVEKRCTVLNSKFIGNSVKSYGSVMGIYFKSVVKFKNCIFSKNHNGKGRNLFGWPFKTYGKGMIACIGSGSKLTAVRCKGLSMAVKKYPL